MADPVITGRRVEEAAVAEGARLTGVRELIDEPGHDPRELSRCLRDLARINRWLGGSRTVLRHLPGLIAGLPGPVRILDVATGYGDLPRAIARWARRRGIRVEIEALDRQEGVLDLAARASAAFPEIRYRKGDALSLPFEEGSFDVALASMVLHHMEGEETVRLLAELERVARRGVLVNDLRRGRWPYLVTWMCLKTLSRSRLIRHDGPLSIRRGFVDGEMVVLARKAGWKHAEVSRHRFFRLALVGKK